MGQGSDLEAQDDLPSTQPLSQSTERESSQGQETGGEKLPANLSHLDKNDNLRTQSKWTSVCSLHFAGGLKTYMINDPTIFPWSAEWPGVIETYNRKLESENTAEVATSSSNTKRINPLPLITPKHSKADRVTSKPSRKPPTTRGHHSKPLSLRVVGENPYPGPCGGTTGGTLGCPSPQFLQPLVDRRQYYAGGKRPGASVDIRALPQLPSPGYVILPKAIRQDLPKGVAIMTEVSAITFETPVNQLAILQQHGAMRAVPVTYRHRRRGDWFFGKSDEAMVAPQRGTVYRANLFVNSYRPNKSSLDDSAQGNILSGCDHEWPCRQDFKL
ncbi:hypothetical protein GWK47_012999 [Chionoecetes opilio]|uniref:Uncharacterized protein n=1 Tax=Chionoecetes opilio TaxID=41210 RepID=A0A8J4XWE8_CHIOP|nr:hypothetical protein GWK47_012999 [Chionoecetes opilio]